MSSRASDRQFNSRSSGCREPYRVSLRPHCLGATVSGVKPVLGWTLGNILREIAIETFDRIDTICTADLLPGGVCSNHPGSA